MKQYILEEPIDTRVYIVSTLITDSPEYAATVAEIDGVLEVKYTYSNHYRITINQLYDPIEVWCRIDDALNELSKPSVWDLEIES